VFAVRSVGDTETKSDDEPLRRLATIAYLLLAVTGSAPGLYGRRVVVRELRQLPQSRPERKPARSSVKLGRQGQQGGVCRIPGCWLVEGREGVRNKVPVYIDFSKKYGVFPEVSSGWPTGVISPRSDTPRMNRIDMARIPVDDAPAPGQ